MPFPRRSESSNSRRRPQRPRTRSSTTVRWRLRLLGVGLSASTGHLTNFRLSGSSHTADKAPARTFSSEPAAAEPAGGLDWHERTGSTVMRPTSTPPASWSGPTRTHTVCSISSTPNSRAHILGFCSERTVRIMRPADAVHRQSLPSSRTFPAVMTRTVVFGAVLWTLSMVFFVDQVIVQLASARPYDLATNLISDLGNSACGPAICSPLHAFMNATFVVVGAFHWIGAASIRPALPRRRLSLAGAVLVALAGWGLIFAGLTPENVDGARHAFGAIVGLASLNLAMIVLGVCLLPARQRPHAAGP
jgi:hypothetical membrane protein